MTKTPVPMDMFLRILDIPVTKPALKALAISNALHYHYLDEWQDAELREQWQYTVPPTTYPPHRSAL